MKLKIPYYAQSSEFSCGPACVLMVFKYLHPEIRLSRTLEFEVWRQCNMIGVRAADPYGMSVPFLDAGLEVRLLTERRRAIDPALWRSRRPRRLTPQDTELALFGVAENRKRALGRGLSVGYGRLTVERIARPLAEGFIPVALVHMGVVHREDIPHWVVVTETDDGHVVFNDPYPPKGGKGIRVSLDAFNEMLAMVGTRNGMSPSALFVRTPPWWGFQTPG